MKQENIKICGVVAEDVTQDMGRSQYKIRAEGRDYRIISSDKQALKDFLFVRKGQLIEVEGSVNIKENNGREIVSEKSKIRLNS